MVKMNCTDIFGEVYLIQHSMIKFVSDLRQIGSFLWVLRFPPPIKSDHHDITEILLKVALNTITPPPLFLLQNCSLFFLIWIFHMIIIKVKFTALKLKFLFQRFNYGRKITTDRWLSKKLSSIYQYKPEAL
jgi:hypothetical protein